MSNSTMKAIVAAHAADSSNRGLFPQPNTPLETLARGSFVTQFDFSYLEGKSLQEQLNQLEANSLQTEGTDELADIEYDAFVNQISAKVAGQIDYAKNTILPVLQEYVKIVTERMVIPTTIMSSFDVVVRDLPAPMTNAGFRSRMEELGEGLYANPEVRLHLPKPEGAIVDKLLTGSTDYDSLVQQWATELGEETLSKMWDDLYTDRGLSANLIDFFERGQEGLNYALFVWFSLNHLLSDIPEGVPYSIQDLKKFTNQYLEAATAAIGRAYYMADAQEKSGILVVSADKFANTVTVNGPVYREFLKNGGKNEALLGGLLGGNLAKTLGEVQSNAEEYSSNYERNEALAAVLRKNDAVNKFKEALIWGIGSLPYDGLSDSEKSAWTEMSISVQSIVAKAQDIIDSLQSHEIEDVHATCLRVLCRSRYFYTDAEKFLGSMGELTKQNPSMDIREAGFMALIEKVGDYVADMIVVRNI